MFKGSYFYYPIVINDKFITIHDEIGAPYTALRITNCDSFKGNQMFAYALKDINEKIEFHRSKIKSFLRWVWMLASLILIVIFLFADYTENLLKTVAQVYIETSLRVTNTSPSDVRFPDFISLINENYFGYWAVSGFVCSLLASLGMLKHHAGRVAYFETEALNLNKLQSVSTIESIHPELASKVIDSCLLPTPNTNHKVILNPILDSITENTSKVIDKLSNK